MSKIIAVWGSAGSGKSMFCCILAKALTQTKQKAIIINADLSTPMLPVWLPDQIIETETSVGQVLSSTDIDTSLVASKVTVLKNYPFNGVMGFTAGENPLSYPEIKYDTVRSLVANAAKLVDLAGRVSWSRRWPRLVPDAMIIQHHSASLLPALREMAHSATAKPCFF